MTVSLTNTSGRCQVFVLAHETYCQALRECRCAREPGRAARRIPGSLTLAAGATTNPQEDAVLAIPEVDRALRRGELSVRQHRAAPARPPRSKGTTLQPQAALRLPAGAGSKKRRGAG
jgi:hypothetical protein